MESCTEIESEPKYFSNAVDEQPDSPDVVSRHFKSLDGRLKSIASRFTVSDNPNHVSYNKNSLQAFNLLSDEHPFVAKVLLELHYDMVFLVTALANLKVIDKPLNFSSIQQYQVSALIALIRDKLRDYDARRLADSEGHLQQV